MRFEIENGDFVGTAEWTGPGRVVLEMEDPKQKAFFEQYFSGHDSFMSGPVECADMAYQRRDESQEAFEHAAFRLAAFAYKVRRGDGQRHHTYGPRR